MNNHYAAPQSRVSDTAPAAAEILGFTGNETYAKKWLNADGSSKHAVQILWSALAFGAVWCWYRKQYLLGVVLWGLEASAHVLFVWFAWFFAALLQQLFDNAQFVSAYNSFAQSTMGLVTALVIARLSFAVMANRIYHNKVRFHLARAPVDHELREQYLVRFGGTDRRAALMAVLISLSIYLFVLGRGYL